MTTSSIVPNRDNFTKKDSINCLICKRIPLPVIPPEPNFPALHEKQAQEGKQ